MPAPYSDNLYSADSDDEHDQGQPDALSPTDGYFHASSESSSSRSPHVPNVLVEDPSQLSRDAKVQEAERERRLLNNGGSAGTASLHQELESAGGSENPIAATPQPELQSQSQSYLQRISTFAHPVDAPPAYSPSPTSPTTVNNYQTFTSTATMGRPEETQPLITHSHAPQSMSNPPANPSQDDQPSRWQKFKDFVARLNIRRRIKTFLASLLIFTVVFMIFSSFTMSSSHGSHTSPVRDNDPVAPPSSDRDELVWRPSKSCLKDPIPLSKEVHELDIQSSRNLSIIQTVKDTLANRGWTTHISGEVLLRPAENSSPARIEVEYISNTEELSVELSMNKTSQLVELIVPRTIDWKFTDKAPCIQIRATIWAPRAAIINALTISTVQLDVNIAKGFVLGALDGVNIRTVSGDINAPAIDASSTNKDLVPYTISSREIRVHTTSGQVKGWYPLYDLLDIGTVSGDITTNIGPKPANPQYVRPATFRVRSASGTIKVDEPIDKAQKASRPDREFPPRDYTVDIITASGDIKADVAASSSASFKSQSGDLNLRVWPVLDSSLLIAAAGKPYLETDTKSGTTQVNLLEPLWTSLATIGGAIPPFEPYDPKTGHEPYIVLREDSDVAEVKVSKPAFSVLQSKHKSISGSINLSYPASWEGVLFAQSASGSQKFQGKGLQIEKEGGTFMKIIRGRKGTGWSSLEVNSVSGDQVAVIGERDH
ncbi:uncharacterized protein FIESC28_11191 [Fusarium coffeatum]|uniref:Adhesin domain-containing protein n=1 Tax=Fusarium coffeatum TaxID=231269 RepID=A0A366QQ72_9HYPO|nr:uncharacterized protein FIESC28_11191 [Fusarium coffeatum]RBR06080.1 hypothetical protein FIESC28_11191 [Fusarium coffeatum]